jgi:dUTP pyrophosphatase
MIFTRIRDVEAPRRANRTDAGIDFYVPHYEEEVAEAIETKSLSVKEVTEDGIILAPGDNVLIPAGVRVIVDEGQALIAFNKSGVASKKGLAIGACVIDRGYEGEVHINLINTSNVDQEIKFGQKIVQFIQIRIDNHFPNEVTEEEYMTICAKEHEDSERGTGGFGSTGV